MAISNQTILKKMSSEIQEAMLNHGDDHKFREHVRAVRLLADLVLEQETSPSGPSASTLKESSVQEPTVEEIRRMMGSDAPVQKPSAQEEKPKGHDGANGSSIFDF
ncbi:YwdI family protein [Halobacillus sp. Marseille-Q1614]|uniref:YwdI family protein n=1 Tax=Halobacillus sp. Marseille-Q1614 TaxID=2709134 RepID=UPI001570D434|nr:YwdI family protein [Halobacillus sp. Marseille-Q1614]